MHRFHFYVVSLNADRKLIITHISLTPSAARPAHPHTARPPAPGQPHRKGLLLGPPQTLPGTPRRAPITEQLPAGTCHMPGVHWELGGLGMEDTRDTELP